MQPIHLAIDIGASSGRHIAAWRTEDRALALKEVYRFPNGVVERDGALTWDIEKLHEEVLRGMAACKAQGIVPDTVGIDTWGVDYVLLDGDGRPIPPAYCYRDKRGAAAAKLVHKIMPFEALYAYNGGQYQPFNTIYQLYDDKRAGRLDRAAEFLMLPAYLALLLSGAKAHEYTNASTTGLMNIHTGQWDETIIRTLGLPQRLFMEAPVLPPRPLGYLLPEVQRRVGFGCDVVLPASHDTASAVAALPRRGAYISSGTWSLLGAEVKKPILTDAARLANFTNEGGVGTIRFQKSFMGLWMIQCLQRETGGQLSFADIAELAGQNALFDYRLNVNADAYLMPASIRAAIDAECREAGFPVPRNTGAYAHAIYHSLARAYADAFGELEAITGEQFDTVCIIGGGAKAAYLNGLTERISGRRVIAGPVEAAAIGNILLQEQAFLQFE